MRLVKAKCVCGIKSNVIIWPNVIMILPVLSLQGFGQADHEMTKHILSRHYPKSNITCSNAGY